MNEIIHAEALDAETIRLAGEHMTDAVKIDTLAVAVCDMVEMADIGLRRPELAAQLLAEILEKVEHLPVLAALGSWRTSLPGQRQEQLELPGGGT